MSNCNSTVTFVDRKLIQEAITAFNSWREHKVFHVREPYIQKAMKHTWWQKLLGKPARTREEAIDYCNYHNYWDDYGFCTTWYYREQLQAKQLQAVLDVSKDATIQLSSEDALFVWNNRTNT